MAPKIESGGAEAPQNMKPSYVRNHVCEAKLLQLLAAIEHGMKDGVVHRVCGAQLLPLLNALEQVKQLRDRRCPLQQPPLLHQLPKATVGADQVRQLVGLTRSAIASAISKSCRCFFSWPRLL